MAKGDLLRLVYDDSNVTYYTTGGPIYRRFVTDRKGETYVEYRNGLDELLGVAREVSYRKGQPRVEFLDRVDNLLAFAEVEHGLLDAAFIGFHDADSPVTIRAKRYLSQEELRRLKSEEPKIEPPPGGGGNGGRTGGTGQIGCLGWVLGVVAMVAGIFLSGVIAKLLTETFADLHYYAYELLNVTQFIATKLAVPMALALCLLFLRIPKGKGAGVVVFYVVLVLLTAAPFVYLSIQLDRMLQPYGYGIQGWNNVKFFLLSFLPGLVYALVTDWTGTLTRKSRNSVLFSELLGRARKIYMILSGVLIFCSRMTAAYVWQLSLDFSSGMFFAFRFIWYVILVVGINSLLFASKD